MIFFFAMVNSWSLLYDTIMSENFETNYEDEIASYYTNNSYSGDELIEFNMGVNENGTLNLSSQVVGSGVPGGMGEDHISLNMNNSNGFWKYNEDKILKEIKEYLGSTYKSHYTSQESKTQTLDLIESIGDAEAFTRSNAIKYLSRFGKKNGKSKQDILKAIHYCILLYHFAGLHKNTTSDFPY